MIIKSLTLSVRDREEIDICLKHVKSGGGVQEATLTVEPKTYTGNGIHAYIKDGFCYVQGYLYKSTSVSLPSGFVDLITGFPKYTEQPLFVIFDYVNNKGWSGRLSPNETNAKLQISLPSAQSIGNLCVNFVYKIAS